MADQHNDNIPAVGNLISADIPDIKENLEWHKDLLQMLLGWHSSTLAAVSPPGPQRSKFDYSSTTAIVINPGVYFHDGTTRQTVFWDAAITFTCGSGGSNAGSTDLGANQRHYVYLDDSAIITQASPELDADCFLNSTTAPTWSDAKHGWYNGSDRCIFAVLTNGSSQIIEFLHDGGDLVFFADQLAGGQTAVTDYDFTNIDVDDTADDVYLPIPAFCTAALATLQVQYIDGGSAGYWRTNGQTATTGHLIGSVASTAAYAQIASKVLTDTSQIIEVLQSASNGNTMSVYADGWFFPTGM